MERSELLDTLKMLVENNDVQGIRKLIRREPEMNELSARELNEDFIINKHRFIKRHGNLSLISDQARYSNNNNCCFLGSYLTRINSENNKSSEPCFTHESVSSRTSTISSIIMSLFVLQQ